MSFKGNLDTLFLNSILQVLCNDEKSGVLELKNQRKSVKIYFQNGDIVYATGSQRENRLGYHLQSKAMISRKKLQECLELAHKQNKTLGTVLVDEGLISKPNLEKIVSDQIEGIIFDLFVWEKGEFEYKDAKVNLGTMVITRLNVVKVMLEASRRIDEMSVLRKYIPSSTKIFRTSEKVKDKSAITLDAEEWKALRLIDGDRTVYQVIDEGGFDEFQAYKTLYALLSAGLIEDSSSPDVNKDTGDSELSQQRSDPL